jgi:hypothetical protein
MKALLYSQVELWQIAAFAEVAIWERRPELQRLCASVPDRGTLGPDQIDKVLPGLSEAARKNIVRYLSYLRLLDERGALTALGRRCAATGKAPAWELGVYHFLVAAHPLFRCHVIDIRRAPADGNDWDFKGLEGVPDWFGPDPARVWTSAFDGALKFTLYALPAPRGVDSSARVEKLQAARLVWSVDLDSGQNAWHIEGELVGERGPVTFRSQPESVPPQKLVGLFAAWENRWNQKSGRLAMAYDGGAADGRETFFRTFRYREVKAGEFGTFSEVVVEGVPVGPSSAAEARQWALSLAIARVEAADAYCSRDAWTKEWAEIVQGTPLEPDAGTAPAPDAVTTVPSGKPLSPRTRWLLNAPSDLAME